MFMRPLALAAALAGLFAANASAAVLFSTLGKTDNGGSNGIFDTDYRLASDFETQGVGASVTGLTLNMTNNDIIDHNFTVSLFSDLGGTVGSLLTSFSTELIAANTSGAVNKLFSHGGYSLVANTKYWVVLEMLENYDNINGDYPVWSGHSGQGIDGGGSFLEVTSTKAQYSNDAGASWNDAVADNFLFNVIGVTVVPEPSRAVLAIAGLFVLGFRRRR